LAPPEAPPLWLAVGGEDAGGDEAGGDEGCGDWAMAAVARRAPAAVVIMRVFNMVASV
jgi:hypothetical protein